MKFFTRYKLTVIDGIRYMPTDMDSANLFFRLIAGRCENNSTIITPKTPFSKSVEIFVSAALANAVPERKWFYVSYNGNQ